MSQKSSDPQAISFVSQPLKRDTRIVPITPPEVPTEFGDADFSAEAIKARADEGEAQTVTAVKKAGLTVA